jgi:hypothetical protein
VIKSITSRISNCSTLKLKHKLFEKTPDFEKKPMKPLGDITNRNQISENVIETRKKVGILLKYILFHDPK